MGAMERMDSSFGGDAAASEAVSLAKRALRARCRQVRDELGADYRKQASERICDRIEQWDIFRSARCVCAYLPMRGEVDLQPLFVQAPAIQWAIPRVVEAPEPHVLFHAYQPNHLVLHRLGMLEPDPDAPLITPGQADLIIVPGLAFTRSGYRLGYGGGYYDRLLAQPGRAATLGTCYEALLLDEIPHLSHDVPVGYLGTEDADPFPVGMMDSGLRVSY
jgi:5-formyltetrahydrofolate cyclo-ligase